MYILVDIENVLGGLLRDVEVEAEQVEIPTLGLPPKGPSKLDLAFAIIIERFAYALLGVLLV